MRERWRMNKRAIRKWESDEEWIRERYGNERAENKIIKAENINERAEYNMSRRVGEGNKWVKKARATTFTI